MPTRRPCRLRRLPLVHAAETNPTVRASHPSGALKVPGEAEQQLVGNGVHQVEKGGVLVQDVVQ